MALRRALLRAAARCCPRNGRCRFPLYLAIPPTGSLGPGALAIRRPFANSLRTAQDLRRPLPLQIRSSPAMSDPDN